VYGPRREWLLPVASMPRAFLFGQAMSLSDKMFQVAEVANLTTRWPKTVIAAAELSQMVPAHLK